VSEANDANAVLRSVVEGVESETGDAFFASLVRIRPKRWA
jgi:hypothetical protein